MRQPPCTPDCPRRCVGCHGNCPDYAAFQAEKAADRKKRQQDSAALDATISGQRRRAAWSPQRGRYRGKNGNGGK